MSNGKQKTSTAKAERQNRENEEKQNSKRPVLERAKPQKYERISSTDIPDEVREAFAKLDYNLRGILFEVDGRIHNRGLAKRMKNEGYTFVTREELEYLGVGWYADFFEDRTVKGRGDALVIGDVALMKNPIETKQGRIKSIQQQTQRELEGVSHHIKKGTLIDTGSKSEVSYKEPNFSN